MLKEREAMESESANQQLTPDPTPVVFLVDIDAFFAQVEQIMAPELAGRPVIVGGLVTDRSVVASASYEARARGVKTAMPLREARRICPDAVFLRGNFRAYARFSGDMMDICRHYTPLVQPVSLDEAYLDVSDCRRAFETQGIVGRAGGTATRRCVTVRPVADEVLRGGSEFTRRGGYPPRENAATLRSTPAVGAAGTETRRANCESSDVVSPPDYTAPDPWPLQAAEHLKLAVKRRLGLVVTVGVGASRLVAKIACDYAKPSGVAWIHPGRERTFLAPLPLKELPGIGPRTAEHLARYNLKRIGDLAQIPPAMLAGHFGPSGEVLAARARGIDPTPVRGDPADPKSISRETTFESNLIDRNAMKAMLYYLLERACRQLRAGGLLARTVGVKVRYADFKTEGRSRSLPTFSDHDDDFWPVAADLFDKAYTRRVGVRLVGVALSHFAPSGRQLDLFAEDRYARRARLYSSIDNVRRRFGFSVMATGRAIELLETHERDANGFRLRTACLSR
jgi:nucleotidyltransferase/DNA polymerase involved in DNA repair